MVVFDSNYLCRGLKRLAVWFGRNWVVTVCCNIVKTVLWLHWSFPTQSPVTQLLERGHNETNAELCCYCWDDGNQADDVTNTTTIITNIMVFLDTAWPYYLVVDYINFVLQRLNINPFASTVTLLSAKYGTVMVNTTNYLSDVYENWNITTHSMYAQGFSLPMILSTARDQAEFVMNAERNSSTMGGQSIVALLVPSPFAFVTDEDFRYAHHFLHHLHDTVPDLHIIYYAGGAVIRFEELVPDPDNDLFPLSLDMSFKQAGEPVVKRIRKVPRRITNARCGSYWSQANWGSNQMLQVARPGSINFYRMVSNYFYPPVSMRYLKVKASSNIAFTVCASRRIPLPYRNGSETPDGMECQQITPTNAFSYDLSDACENYGDIRKCPPLYLSVQPQSFANAMKVSCTAAVCQTPDQAQYYIFVNNLSCGYNRYNNAAPCIRFSISSCVLFIIFYFIVMV